MVSKFSARLLFCTQYVIQTFGFSSVRPLVILQRENTTFSDMQDAKLCNPGLYFSWVVCVRNISPKTKS